MSGLSLLGLKDCFITCFDGGNGVNRDGSDKTKHCVLIIKSS